MSTTEPVSAQTMPRGSTQPDVSTAFIIRFFIATIGIYLVLMTPAAMTLAIHVGTIAPDRKEAALGTILGVGAFMALLANPIFGRVSDMTRSRFGRRKPWIVIGIVGGGLACAAIPYADSLFVVGLCWALAQTFYNAVLATLIAVIPDRVPEHQRGRVSALMGMSIYLGMLGGSWILSMTGTGPGMFVVPVLVGLAGVLLFILPYADAPSDRMPRAPLDAGALLGSFWINPRQQPDFAWAWASRFLVLFGFAVLMTYQVYFLSDVLGIAADRIGDLMFRSMLITAVAVVVSATLAGWASDRSGARKPFVIGSAAIYALGIAILIFAGTLEMFYLAIAIAGVGLGTYLSVDQALVVDILPNREHDAGKDLGVFNIANAVPQALAPAIAPFFLAFGGGGNFALLYTVAALAAFAGALCIFPVRGVR